MIAGIFFYGDMIPSARSFCWLDFDVLIYISIKTFSVIQRWQDFATGLYGGALAATDHISIVGHSIYPHISYMYMLIIISIYIDVGNHYIRHIYRCCYSHSIYPYILIYIQRLLYVYKNVAFNSIVPYIKILLVFHYFNKLHAAIAFVQLQCRKNDVELNRRSVRVNRLIIYINLSVLLCS